MYCERLSRGSLFLVCKGHSDRWDWGGLFILIVYGANRKYYERAKVSIRSCLHWNPDANIVLLAEDDSVEGLDERVKVIKYNEEEIKSRLSEHCITERLSVVIFLKLMIAEMFPEESRALWLDCDTIVNSSLAFLEQFNIDTYAYAMVPEIYMSFHLPEFLQSVADRYFNAGVILYNLDVIRELKIEQKAFEFCKRNNTPFKEQDALNYIASGLIRSLPTEWNDCPCTNHSLDNDPKIIHYALIENYWTGETIRGNYWKRFM